MSNVLVSRKISLKNVFWVAWIIAMIILVAVLVDSFVEYNRYEKMQKAAVDVCLMTDKYDTWTYENKKEMRKLAKDIYDDLHPNPYFSSDAVMKSASEVDWALGDALEKWCDTLGYDWHGTIIKGSKYLQYTDYFGYTMYYFSSKFTVWGIFALILLMVNLRYVASTKKTMMIDGEKILCKKGEKTVKEFMIKDVKSVELASMKGLKVVGNGIKYKINLLKNAEELKKTIMDSIAILSAKTADSAVEIKPTSADELKKYKELLDSGIINQEEYNAKKKQLLGL